MKGNDCERFDFLLDRSSWLLTKLGDPIALAHGILRGNPVADPCIAKWIELLRRGVFGEHPVEVRNFDSRRKKRRRALWRMLTIDRATHRSLAEARTLLALTRETLFDTPSGRRHRGYRARTLEGKALSIMEKEGAASFALAQAIGNSYLSMGSKGEVALQQRRLELLSNLSPTSREKASAFAALGNAYHRQGQLDLAELYLRLSISEDLQENEQARSSRAFQEIYRSRGDLELANFYGARVPKGQDVRFQHTWVRGLADRWFFGPLVVLLSSDLDNMRARPEFSELLRLQSMGVTIRDASAREAALLTNLRYATMRSQSTLDPQIARINLELGETKILLGKYREGREHILLGLDELDRADLEVGGASDSRASYELQVQYLYRQAVLALLDAGNAFEAVETLDRGRGRELTRPHRTSSEPLSPTLLALDRRIDLLISQLENFHSSSSKDKLLKIRAEIRDLRSAERLLGGPKTPKPSDSLRPPRLSFSEIRGSLDPGTLLLYYVVGSHETDIFAVRSAGEPSLSIFHFPIESYVLASKVKAFRKGIGESHDPKEAEAVALYDLLVLPAQSLIETSDRIAICADGPLLSLPFTALRHDDKYLAELRPVHRIASVVSFKRLKDRRTRTRDAKLWNIVAFADPRYSEAGGSQDGVRDPALTRAVERGLSLAPLPASRFEAEGLAESFPSTRAFLGTDASESNAREYSASADVLHFACHGLLDSDSPYDSALALATPKRAILGRDNGLLQAWEVGERLSLKAELVTLSACKTALGDAGSGEGLLGMSWAFQAAGARSVVASTWSVSDRETAELMKRFYRHLSEGLPKDEALRSAQADMIHSGDTALAAPAAWAGFELFGDWR